MTVGQRIAQKRKELALSQEALGEQLGVSRQAIYKWESDATLPEIEKLITLSRIFSVSVGWLLGEEEQESAPEDKELTEEQLRMVEEIVHRYLEAQPRTEEVVRRCLADQPEPEKPKKRRWPWLLGIAAVIAVIIVFVNLFDRLDRVTNNYNNLQNSISNISSSVNMQIGSITNRVEEILHQQNELTAEWGTELVGIDIPANTATFRIRAVPKTYREGMTALFVARSEGETVEVPVEVGAGNAFDGEITCNLTDDIDLTVVFVTEGQRETQILDRYSYLYSNTFPGVMFMGGGLWMDERDGVIPADGDSKEHFFYEEKDSVYNQWQAKAVEVRVGLFKDQKLVHWYREEMNEVIYNGVKTERPWYFWDETVLEPGSVYCEAAVITDEYGRTMVWPDTPIRYSETSGWHHGGGVWDSGPVTPEGWEF